MSRSARPSGCISRSSSGVSCPAAGGRSTGVGARYVAGGSSGTEGSASGWPRDCLARIGGGTGMRKPAAGAPAAGVPAAAAPAAEAAAPGAGPAAGTAGDADTCGGVRVTTPAGRPPLKPPKLRKEAAPEDRTEEAAACEEPADLCCCRRQEPAAEDAAERCEAAEDGAAVETVVETEVCSTPAAPARAARAALPSGRMKATSGGVEAAWKPDEERSCLPKSSRSGGDGASAGSVLSGETVSIFSAMAS